MAEPPLPAVLKTVTSTTLLKGLEDPANRSSWDQYVGRYRPLIVRLGTRLGLVAEEAEDLAQNSLLAFSTAYREGKYRRDLGSLRAWLFGIVHNQLRNLVRRRDQEVQVRDESGGTGFFGRLPAASDSELEALWEEEWRQAVLRQCLQEVRAEVEERSYEAFRRFALEEQPAAEVARSLHLTPNAVYGAKRRVLQRLREILPLMEEAW